MPWPWLQGIPCRFFSSDQLFLTPAVPPDSYSSYFQERAFGDESVRRTYWKAPEYARDVEMTNKQ